jgi:hypothetical protein
MSKTEQDCPPKPQYVRAYNAKYDGFVLRPNGEKSTTVIYGALVEIPKHLKVLRWVTRRRSITFFRIKELIRKKRTEGKMVEWKNMLSSNSDGSPRYQ